jgi:hypothetical protein
MLRVGPQGSILNNKSFRQQCTHDSPGFTARSLSDCIPTDPLQCRSLSTGVKNPHKIHISISCPFQNSVCAIQFFYLSNSKTQHDLTERLCKLENQLIKLVSKKHWTGTVQLFSDKKWRSWEPSKMKDMTQKVVNAWIVSLVFTINQWSASW